MGPQPFQPSALFPTPPPLCRCRPHYFPGSGLPVPAQCPVTPLAGSPNLSSPPEGRVPFQFSSSMIRSRPPIQKGPLHLASSGATTHRAPHAARTHQYSALGLNNTLFPALHALEVSRSFGPGRSQHPSPHSDPAATTQGPRPLTSLIRFQSTSGRGAHS